MPWTGDPAHRFAPTLLELLHQLEQRYPGPQWLNSPQTGTIGDAAHRAESSSDHNPWLNNTVRALDVAADTTAPGLVPVHDAPDCEALFAMGNEMYGRRDPRIWPDGYVIYRARITDPERPGQFKTYTGPDLHYGHIHFSASTNPAGYNSTAPWPLPGPTPSTDWFSMATLADLQQAVAATPVKLDAATQVAIRQAAARASGPMFVTFADASLNIRAAIYEVTSAGLRFIPGTEFAEIQKRWGGPPYVVTSTTKSIWWRLPIVPGTLDPRK